MVLARWSTQSLDQDLHTLWSPFLSFKDTFLSSAPAWGRPDVPSVSRTCFYQVNLGCDRSATLSGQTPSVYRLALKGEASTRICVFWLLPRALSWSWRLSRSSPGGPRGGKALQAERGHEQRHSVRMKEARGVFKGGQPGDASPSPQGH